MAKYIFNQAQIYTTYRNTHYASNDNKVILFPDLVAGLVRLQSIKVNINTIVLNAPHPLKHVDDSVLFHLWFILFLQKRHPEEKIEKHWIV